MLWNVPLANGIFQHLSCFFSCMLSRWMSLVVTASGSVLAITLSTKSSVSLALYDWIQFPGCLERSTVEVDMVSGYSKLHCGTLDFYLWVPLFLWCGWSAAISDNSVSALFWIILHQDATYTGFLGSINNQLRCSVRVKIGHDRSCC